jgi:hypothetical protein
MRGIRKSVRRWMWRWSISTSIEWWMNRSGGGMMRINMRRVGKSYL